MKNLVILCPTGPFSKRDYERFGIKFLKKNFSVKIFNFTAWIYPDLWKEQLSKVYECEEHITISCKNDFLASNSEEDSSIVLDCLEKNRKTNWARRQLKKKNSLFVGVDLNLIPEKKCLTFFLSSK